MRPQPVSTLDDPLDHLLACHRRIEDRLATLERIGDRIEHEREACLDALRRCNSFFATNGVWHSADEEESVFPRLLPHLDYGERSFLAQLAAQHDEAEGLHERLNALAANPSGGPAWAARLRSVISRLVRLYRDHIAVEDEVLIRLGRTHLTEDDLLAASTEMKNRRGQD